MDHSELSDSHRPRCTLCASVSSLRGITVMILQMIYSLKKPHGIENYRKLRNFRVKKFLCVKYLCWNIFVLIESVRKYFDNENYLTARIYTRTSCTFVPSAQVSVRGEYRPSRCNAGHYVHGGVWKRLLHSWLSCIQGDMGGTTGEMLACEWVPHAYTMPKVNML